VDKNEKREKQNVKIDFCDIKKSRMAEEN